MRMQLSKPLKRMCPRRGSKLQQQTRVPFLVIQPSSMGHGLHNLSSAVLSVFPSARDELRQLYESVDADDYISAAIFSSTVVGATFALFLTIISISRGFNPLMLGFGALLGMCMFAFYIIYPGILVRKIAQKTDNELVFALRELSLQIESGVALYDAMANIASGNYGRSEEHT